MVIEGWFLGVCWWFFFKVRRIKKVSELALGVSEQTLYAPGLDFRGYASASSLLPKK